MILTTLTPDSPVNTAQNNAGQPQPQDQERQNEENFDPKRQPKSAGPLLIRHRPPNMPGRMSEGNQQQLQVQPQPDNIGETSQPNGTKTPEQLLQEQQTQEQLNPANRQPNGTKTPEQLLQELQQMQQQQQQMQEQSNHVDRQPPQ